MAFVIASNFLRVRSDNRELRLTGSVFSCLICIVFSGGDWYSEDSSPELNSIADCMDMGDPNFWTLDGGDFNGDSIGEIDSDDSELEDDELEDDELDDDELEDGVFGDSVDLSTEELGELDGFDVLTVVLVSDPVFLEHSSFPSSL